MLLGGGAVVVAGGAAGAFLLLGGPGGGPKGVVKQYVNAIDSGNAEKANSLLHPSGTADRIGSTSASMMEQANINVKSAEVVSETETSATVRATIAVSFQGRSQESTTTIELRKYQDEWRIYSTGGGFS